MGKADLHAAEYRRDGAAVGRKSRQESSHEWRGSHGRFQHTNEGIAVQRLDHLRLHPHVRHDRTKGQHSCWSCEGLLAMVRGTLSLANDRRLRSRQVPTAIPGKFVRNSNAPPRFHEASSIVCAGHWIRRRPFVFTSTFASTSSRPVFHLFFPRSFDAPSSRLPRARPPRVHGSFWRSWHGSPWARRCVRCRERSRARSPCRRVEARSLQRIAS